MRAQDVRPSDIAKKTDRLVTLDVADVPKLPLPEYLKGIPRLECLGGVPSGTPVLVRGEAVESMSSKGIVIRSSRLLGMILMVAPADVEPSVRSKM